MLLNQKMHKNVIQLWINIPGIKIGENVVDVRRENLKLSTSARILHTGGFHITSLQLPPSWWTKTKDRSLAPFVRPPAVVHYIIVICVSEGWLQTSNLVVSRGCQDENALEMYQM